MSRCCRTNDWTFTDDWKTELPHNLLSKASQISWLYFTLLLRLDFLPLKDLLFTSISSFVFLKFSVEPQTCRDRIHHLMVRSGSTSPECLQFTFPTNWWMILSVKCQRIPIVNYRHWKEQIYNSWKNKYLLKNLLLIDLFIDRLLKLSFTFSSYE